MERGKICLQSPVNPGTFGDFLRARTSLAERSIETYVRVVSGLLRRLRAAPITIEEANLFLRRRPSAYCYHAVSYYLKFVGREPEVPQLIRFKKKPPVPRQIPTLEEVMQVVEALDDDNKYLALFLLNTGARCHEALKLQLRHVHLDGTVTLETKGGKYRTFKLSPDFNTELQHYLREVKGIAGLEAAFYTESQARLSTRVFMFDRALNRKAKGILGKRIGTHDFRRLFAVTLYRKYRDLQLVQKILGHSDIGTTAVYAKYAVTQEDVEDAAAAMTEEIKKARKKPGPIQPVADQETPSPAA